jgi:hypothetical protein
MSAIPRSAKKSPLLSLTKGNCPDTEAIQNLVLEKGKDPVLCSGRPLGKPRPETAPGANFYPVQPKLALVEQRVSPINATLRNSLRFALIQWQVNRAPEHPTRLQSSLPSNQNGGVRD